MGKVLLQHSKILNLDKWFTIWFFSSKRGLGWELPSPFIFILAMEGQTEMLRTTQIKNWIRGLMLILV